MTTLLKSVVPAGVSSFPAEKYIERAWPLLSRNRVDMKRVRVNGEKAPAVSTGDEVSVYVDGKVNFDLETVYADEELAVFVKPDGLPVDVDESGIGEDTVISRLKLKYDTPFLVHRLDAGTSGLMLAALNDAAREKLEALFREHLVEKTYRADVLGRMPQKTATLNAYLQKDAAASKVKVVKTASGGAKDITTVYRVVDERNMHGSIVSRLYVNIPTGRTHQIRAHLAYTGHPLLGDDKYGDRDANKRLKAKRIRLRCVALEIKTNTVMPEYSGKKFSCGEDEKWTYLT